MRFVAVLGMASVAACAGDGGPTAPTTRDVVRGGNTVVSPNEYMASVGCIRRTSLPDSGGVIVIPGADTVPVWFLCGSPGSAPVRAALKEYRAALRSGLGGAFSQNGHIEWVARWREWCRPTGGEQYGDIWVLGPDDFLYDCQWLATWVPTWVPGDPWPTPEEGGGGGGEPPDTTPPPPIDSTAIYAEWVAAETDDTQGYEGLWVLTDIETNAFNCRTQPRKCPKPSAYVNSPAVISAAASMVAATKADGLERGAWLFRNTDGSIRVGEWHTGNIWGQIPTMASNLMPADAIGSIHSHPQNDPPSGNDGNVSRETGTYSTIATTNYLFLLDPQGTWIYKGARPIP